MLTKRWRRRRTTISVLIISGDERSLVSVSQTVLTPPVSLSLPPNSGESHHLVDHQPRQSSCPGVERDGEERGESGGPSLPSLPSHWRVFPAPPGALGPGHPPPGQHQAQCQLPQDPAQPALHPAGPAPPQHNHRPRPHQALLLLQLHQAGGHRHLLPQSGGDRGPVQLPRDPLQPVLLSECPVCEGPVGLAGPPAPPTAVVAGGGAVQQCPGLHTTVTTIIVSSPVISQ